MDWREPEYFKLFPAQVLLDIANLNALQRGGWASIWLWMKRQWPPGLMDPMNLDRLAEWSEMRSGDWERNRLAILGKFLFHPGSGSFHDPQTQRSYVEFARLKMRNSAGGKASADRRNNRKIGRSAAADPDPATPYARFAPPFWEIQAENWDHMCQILQEKRQVSSVLQVSSKSLESVYEDTSTSVVVVRTTNNAATPARALEQRGLAAAESAAGFLARHSDAQLADIHRRWSIQATPFLAQHYRDKNPRHVHALAQLLCDFGSGAQESPATQDAPPARSEGVA